MPLITFTPAERTTIVQRIQKYCAEELEQDIGQFEAGFLLNFFVEEIGPHFYNKGLLDAQAILRKRIDDISEAIDSLEKPLRAKR